MTVLNLKDLCSSPPHAPLVLADLWSYERFREARPAILPLIIEEKNRRRVKVGPWATMLFESKVLLWWQIQEMMRLENGGPAQALEELEAYRALLPGAQELSFTMMLELDDTQTRPQQLVHMAHIEKNVWLRFASGESLQAVPVDARENLNPAHKASTVNFMKFSWREFPGEIPKNTPHLSIEHASYHHSAPLLISLWNVLREELQA